jgi:hypothetical protein
MYIPLEDGESIVRIVHRHWWFIALRFLAIAAIGVALPVVVGLLAGLKVLSLAGAWPAMLALWALWGLVLWTLFWQFWTTYFMDTWVITNRRIIDIDYHRLFDRNIAMLRLDRVQDVTTHVEGVMATMLKYGSVLVQTAGTQDEFLIDQIADPEGLRDTISSVVGLAADRLRVVKLEQ